MTASDYYLGADGLERAIAAHREVEQWLEPRKEADVTVVSWVGIEYDDEDTVVRFCEVIDEGGPKFFDVYEFTPWVADTEFGVTTPFSTPQEAIMFAVNKYGAKTRALRRARRHSIYI